jgi:hypothetical protein
MRAANPRRCTVAAHILQRNAAPSSYLNVQPAKSRFIKVGDAGFEPATSSL